MSGNPDRGARNELGQNVRFRPKADIAARMALTNRTWIVVALAAGCLVGATSAYVVVYRQGEALAAQRTDLINATRAVDFDNRLTMLRALRAAGAKDVASFEISAVLLLGVTDVASAPDSATAVVLRHAAKTLASYQRDFPESEFNDARHASLRRLLAWQ